MDESGGLENRYGASHRGFEFVEVCLLIKGVMTQAIVGSNPTPTAIIDRDKTVGVDESGGLVF